MENILKRISKIVDNENITITSLESKIGASKGVLSRALSKNTDIQSKWLISIVENYPHYNSEWLLTGRGSMLKRNDSNNIELNPIRISNTKRIDIQEVPIYDTAASASIQSVFLDSSKIVPLDHIKIPNLPKVDGAIRITGDSMYPLLKSGDIVLYKEGFDKAFIIWGEMYLVYIEKDGEEYFAVKYLQKSDKEDHIKLISYNDHHQPKEFHIDCLKKWALIKASIRINSGM